MLKRQWVIGSLAALFSFSANAIPLAYDFDFTAYSDVSYNYLVKDHQFINGINNRVNDTAQNGITLQQAAFTLTRQPAQGWGGTLNVLAGRDANYLAPYGWNPYYGSQTLAMMVPEAFVQYSQGAYTVLGGFMESAVGYENYNPTKDANFSRGILNGYAEPGFFQSLRLLYAPSEKIKVNAGVNNGWSGYRDRGRGKSFEAGASYAFNPDLSLTLQTLTGQQRLITNTVSGPTGVRNIVNLFMLWNATSKLSLGASGDYAAQAKALADDGDVTGVSWQGLAGYLNYQWREKWNSSVRAEWYLDPNGYTTGVAQNWREVTLTLGYIPMKNVLVRAETRRDISNRRSFSNASGPGAAHYQQSFALEGIYSLL